MLATRVCSQIAKVNVRQMFHVHGNIQMITLLHALKGIWTHMAEYYNKCVCIRVFYISYFKATQCWLSDLIKNLVGTLAGV